MHVHVLNLAVSDSWSCLMEALCHIFLPFVSPWMVMFIVIGLALATSFYKYPREIIWLL